MAVIVHEMRAGRYMYMFWTQASLSMFPLAPNVSICPCSRCVPTPRVMSNKPTLTQRAHCATTNPRTRLKLPNEEVCRLTFVCACLSQYEGSNTLPVSPIPVTRGQSFAETLPTASHFDCRAQYLLYMCSWQHHHVVLGWV